MRSAIQHVSHTEFPKFRGVRCLMVGMSLKTLDKQGMGEYTDVIRNMMSSVDIRGTDRFFVTIDERQVVPGKTHRRPGAHIDGNWIEKNAAGRWDTGGWINNQASAGRWQTAPGDWETNRLQTGGMLIAASEAASVAWRGVVDGVPGEGGSCEHLRDQLSDLIVVPMLHNRVYLANSTCIHESLPVAQPMRRQLIRITLPHDMVVL